MLAEWSLLGFLVPPLALPVLIALGLYLLLRRVFVRLGLYHWFWQPVLLDIGLYALLLWSVLALAGALPIAPPKEG
ncbi:DUF1656 domain-containing protein [Chromohalobacter canadensis]|uniref:DUF1656 domain-containing protein n=1 Tax=Chromohalobacter canadensis TaxID=141389 RepID=A0A285VCU4_9GAMM|nr:DUF1656 domain-containing protein [Chromohalobacter canadensis]MCK0770287.1 DUF1656 domain-containing protein [Chromohalobacter canadensis]MCT8468898.1 DUF1656 domain-containing protein [Chromohalobacter canadensis]MCT8472912.1 DUF1656 domain-containing protein [Chromohalobacter canadensis]MCT8500364.1 DUF1656 domain-containing protein [Chromohalobacter canadensis]WQH10424.1 DUF1656 domain-containing protein [Chromohalobacter canadensis]